MTVSERTYIQELARRYQVQWELFPAVTFINHKKQQYGFELELAGTCQQAEWNPSGACRAKIYDALRCIASSVLPHEQRATVFQISPFDRAIHYCEERGSRPDVLLTITLAHACGGFAPVDECERRCLREITQGLEALGVVVSAPPITGTAVWRPAL